MAVSQSDIDALDRALSAGVKEVRFADRTVTYNSTADILAAKSAIQSELNGQNNVQTRRQYRLFTGKGW